MSGFVREGQESHIQHEVDDFTAQAQANKLQFIEEFNLNPIQFDPILINNNPVEVVNHAKIPGLDISENNTLLYIFLVN